MLVPIESLYVTSCYWTVLTYILSYTVFQLLLSNGHIIAFDKAAPLVNAPVLGNLCEYCHKSYIAKN